MYLGMYLGKPIWACRVSFGLHNTKQDGDEWIEFLTRYFVEEKRISLVSVGVGGKKFVSQICIYPIKSCAAVYLDSVNINKNGFEFDRKWMIVDQEGKGLTQKSYAELSEMIDGGVVWVCLTKEVEGSRNVRVCGRDTITRCSVVVPEG
jgi:hypothetical protein